MATVTTRPATDADVDAAVDVLRRSITELCRADHRDDPESLARWLANKTPARLRDWLAKPTLHTIVAEREGSVCGVGMLGADGTLHLCYVHPDHIRCGVGRQLVAALERHARDAGLERVTLDATITAVEFYEALGYRSEGPSTAGFGVARCRAYAKRLAPDS